MLSECVSANTRISQFHNFLPTLFSPFDFFITKQFYHTFFCLVEDGDIAYVEDLDAVFK